MFRKMITILFSLILCVSLFPVSVKAEDETIKVGYYENEVFEEGASEGAVKKGYAYEYYRKLSEYTGWRYEYVYGSFGELYQKLVDGEIDLIAGLAYKEDRAQVISYPERPMGNETYNLVKYSDDDSITTDLETLNGKRIAVLDSAMVDVLKKYLEDNDVDAKIVTFKDHEMMFAAFDNREVDILAAEGDGAYGRDNAEVLCAFGASDYYICVSKKREDLLEELNDAQRELSIEEPNYISTLNAKYYSLSVSSRAYSDDEKEWLENHESLKIGFFKNYLPYSDLDKDGNPTGIIVDVIPEIFKSLNLNDLQFEYIAYESYDDMIKAVNDQEVDIIFPVGGGLYYSEESGIYQSNTVVSTSSDLIYKGEYSEESTRHFAINEKNRMQYYFVKTHFPDAEITYCDSPDECLKAVLENKVTCSILNGLRTKDILKNRKYAGLNSLQMTQSDDKSFGIKIGNEGLLKLVNRGINVVGTDYAQNQTYRYSEMLYAYTFEDMLADNAALFATIFLGVALMVIFFLAREGKRTRLQMEDKEKDRLLLEEKNVELEMSRDALSENNDIIADAGYGIWHIMMEEGKKPRMRVNAKMKEILGIESQELDEEETYDAWYSRIVEDELPSVTNFIKQMKDGVTSECTYRWNHPS